MTKSPNQQLLLRFIDSDDERCFTVYGDHFALVSLVRTLVDSGLVSVTASYIKDIEKSEKSED